MDQTKGFGPFRMITNDSPELRESLIWFDWSDGGSLSVPNKVPDHALDTGRVVQDHVIFDPDTFDIECRVTETPLPHVDRYMSNVRDIEESLGTVLEDYAPRSSGGLNRCTEVMALLRTCRGRRWSLVSPRYGELTDFVIVGMSFGTNGPRGVLNVRINFKKVEYANVAVVGVPTVDRAKKAAKAPECVCPEESPVSSEELGYGQSEEGSILWHWSQNPGSAQGTADRAYNSLPENGAAGAGLSFVGGF